MVQIAECIIFRGKNDSYEFLLLKRTPKEGGFWQFAGGKLEDKETTLEAAYRETDEETGIKKNQIIKIIENVYDFSFDEHYLTGAKIDPVQEFVFGLKVQLDTKIDIERNPCNEHEDYGWFSYDKALELLKWDNNKEALKKLFLILESN